MNAAPNLQVQNRDDDSAKRRQILEGARRVFMDLGFDGASMGEIARAAGVSKGTLYVYFTDKSALFEAIVEKECHDHGITALDIESKDAGSALRLLGQAYMEVLCRPEGGSAVRTVMAIAERMPDLGRQYYGNVPATWFGKLADYLRTQVKAGHLVIENCDLAAAQFMLACQATLFLPFIFQVRPPPSSEQIAKVVDSATRMFLAAYRPPGKS